MEWRLRRAAPADAAALSLVAGATFLQTFAGVLEGADILAHVARNSSADAFARYMEEGAMATLAEARAGGAPIGYTLLTVPDLPVAPQAGDIELKRIYVLAGAHGGGLGPALMARAVEDARAAGHERMLLGVYGENHRARRFYEKQGFALAGTRRFLVGATWHDDVIYALPL
ncbi:GNAT family N-acetyltransferase [Sphingomonas adhaesiva]|uniref:GNAT family N-acetyltransferase n=1 Tax=Sphingomonas adhaesiva TaxID=28212 RepID=UPI002FFD4847